MEWHKQQGRIILQKGKIKGNVIRSLKLLVVLGIGGGAEGQTLKIEYKKPSIYSYRGKGAVWLGSVGKFWQVLVSLDSIGIFILFMRVTGWHGQTLFVHVYLDVKEIQTCMILL